MRKSSQPAEVTSKGLVGLDRLLEHRSRLGACVLLAGVDSMTFTSLKQFLKETDGNLGGAPAQAGGRQVSRRVQALREPQAGDLVQPNRKGYQGPAEPPRIPADSDSGGEALRCRRE